MEKNYTQSIEYKAACHYNELHGLVRRISGAPSGYHYQVPWQRPVDISRVNWIQADMASGERQSLSHCTDHQLLVLWKKLQSELATQGPAIKRSFESLLFTEIPDNFQPNLRLYLKAFKACLPLVRLFFISLYNQKNPH